MGINDHIYLLIITAGQWDQPGTQLIADICFLWAAFYD